jgi:hypothetical protein
MHYEKKKLIENAVGGNAGFHIRGYCNGRSRGQGQSK